MRTGYDDASQPQPPPSHGMLSEIWRATMVARWAGTCAARQWASLSRGGRHAELGGRLVLGGTRLQYSRVRGGLGVDAALPGLGVGGAHAQLRQ